jgi:endonuclease III
MRKTNPTTKTRLAAKPMARPRGAPKGPRESLAARTERATRILDILDRTYPDADCALKWRNPYELLAATILSAQCTDERVNSVTPALFERYPTPADLASARSDELEALIRPTGFFRSKAKSLVGCAKGLVADHAGDVPRSMEALVKLPGTGRKTASVVLGHAWGLAEGIAVDTHVMRVSNRLGLVDSDVQAEIERQLMALIPRERWIKTTDLFIFHGRRICIAQRPRCGECPVFALCRWEYKQAYAAGEAPGAARAAKVARPRARE